MGKYIYFETNFTMDILQKDDGKKGLLYIEIEGELLGEMHYVWSGVDRFIIDHTEVSNKLAGKGIGKQLVHRAVEFAREKHLKVLPLCPFAKALFDKIEAYQDVLF